MTPATPQLAQYPVIATHLSDAHLTVDQMEALLASSAAPFSAIIPSIAATEEYAVILAQPESQYWLFAPAIHLRAKTAPSS